MFLIFDGGREKLHGCHTPFGFGADQKAQNVLLRTNIAICRGHGDLAKDSLDNRDPLCSIALADCNDTIRLLDRQGLYPIFKSARGITAMSVIACIEDLRLLARRRVPRMFYDYVDSGFLDRKHVSS